MQAQAEIGAADHPRILFGLEPAGPKLYAPRRQPGEPALELHAPRAVSGDQDDEIGKPSSSCRRFPTANAVLEPTDRVDHHVEILVLVQLVGHTMSPLTPSRTPRRPNNP